MYATNNRVGNYEKEGKYKRNVTEMFEDNKMVTKDRHYKAKKTSIHKIIEKTKRLNNTNPTKNNIEKTKIEQHEPH
jgi:hypothetical protein